MNSRKEEERNEKIIRGLMKLPPNRRCINCNSLGPQYVCTNFWTFICITCSGIHREFTHRVKSVSMAKFTSQEVEALQNGGNQRAREIYLKDWDFQRQRLPDSSNVEKIRDFIKNVYVVQRYTGGKDSDKPPRDIQSPKKQEETRRASSYHSYSQSPPYDYQYEDRRYGKPSAALSRKPGSDRGHYESKMSSFMCSPGRFVDQAFEDRFANDGSGPRISDHSGSSHGEPFKSDVPSPNSHKDYEFSSPSNQSSTSSSSKDVWSHARVTSLETNSMRVTDGIPHPQRTASSGSFGSLESNSFSLKSYNISSEPKHCLPNWSQPLGLARCVSLDPPKAPSMPETVLSTPSIDLFESLAPSQASSVDAFQPSFLAGQFVVVNQNCQSSQAAPVDFFSDMSHKHLTTTANKITEEFAAPKNDGWATFDAPQSTVSTPHVDVTPKLQHCVALSVKFDPFPATNSSMQSSSTDTPQPTMATTALIERDSRLPISDESLPEKNDPLSLFHSNFEFLSFVNSGTGEPSTKSNPWNDFLPKEHSPVAEPWNSFENAKDHYSVANDQSDRSIQMNSMSSSEDQQLDFMFSEEFDKGKTQTSKLNGEVPDNRLLSHIIAPPSVLPLMGETWKSHNPFDLPFLSDSEKSNTFLDMSSFQGALPNSHLQSSFDTGAEPWFSQTPYISSAAPGGLTFIATQPPTCPFPTVQSQGPVASVGGNPFA